MRKHVLLYGLLGGALIALLKVVEYRYLVIERSVEIYGGLIAAVFAATGIWLGLKLTRSRERVVIREVAAPASFTLNEEKLGQLGITPRELEILTLIAAGLSTREIAGLRQARRPAPDPGGPARGRRAPAILGPSSTFQETPCARSF